MPTVSYTDDEILDLVRRVIRFDGKCPLPMSRTNAVSELCRLADHSETIRTRLGSDYEVLRAELAGRG